MKVSALKAQIRRLWVEVPGEEEGSTEKIWVDYRPGALTLEVSEELKDAVQSGFETDVAFSLLRRVLAGWDLQNDEGGQLGVSDAEIKTIPLQFLGKIMQAIEEDSRPNAERDVTSSDSSQQREQQETSPNGTSSSEQRTGSLVSRGSF